ncbi:hypothetical protein BsWGS_12068 [Bradybaena similaris]
MFQLSDEDLLWDDDFPVEDITVGEGTSFTCGSKSLPVGSFPTKPLAQGDIGLESLKHEANNSASTSLQSHLYANDNYSKKYNHDGTAVQTENLPKLSKRKFPGPAGILPPYSPSVVLDTKLPNSPDVVLQAQSPKIGDLKDELQPSQLPWSQAVSDDIFKSPQWKALVADLGNDSESLIAKFSIKSALFKASRKLLHRGKVPLIIGVIDSLEMQGSDASIVIRDPSGKMNGALHRDLFKDQSTALQIGSVLVLRQVSVISPSCRTHYLNITPGNVVLVYTSNKEAAVSIQLYDVSHSFTNGHEIETNVSKKQFLCDIIQISEQELSDAVNNSHQRHKTYMSPSLENVSNGFNNRYLSPAMSRDPLGLHRNHMNVTSSGRSSVSLFSCSPQSMSNGLHGRAITQQSSVKMTGSANITFPKQMMSNPVQVHGSEFPLRHGPPVQSLSVTHADRPSSPAFQQSRSGFTNSNISPVLPNQDRSQLSSCLNLSLGKDTIHDKTTEVKSSSNIPHDDEMLLLFSDDDFSQNPDENNISNRVDVGRAHCGEFGRDEGIMRNNSHSGNVISEVFSNCRKENERINNNFKKENLCMGSSLLLHVDDQLQFPGCNLNMDTNVTPGSANNSTATPQANIAAKKFSFKRSLPTCDVPQLPVLGKRLASAVGHQTFDTAKKNTLIHSSSLPVVRSSVESCDSHQAGLRPHASVVELSTVKSPVARVNYAPGVNCATSTVQQATPSSVFSNTGFNLKQAVYSKPMAELRCSSTRDTGSTGHSSVFQVWDSDLSDEMLLSQLSEEF